MKKLTKARFNRARDFILSEARPLEKATFKLEFESGTVIARRHLGTDLELGGFLPPMIGHAPNKNGAAC